MKIWIDKQGGTHYHKADCKMIEPMPRTTGSLTPINFHYEEIEHRLRGNSLMGYRDIIVDGLRYSSCPMCFGYRERI